MLYVAPGTGTVAAKLSTWPDAQSPTMLEDTLRAFDAAGAALAGLDADDQRRHGPPGVAAGLSRGRIGGGSPALRACCDRYGHVARVTAELPRVMDERERG
jgi:hypothetical protein